jgi:hypothetical protein
MNKIFALLFSVLALTSNSLLYPSQEDSNGGARKTTTDDTPSGTLFCGRIPACLLNNLPSKQTQIAAVAGSLSVGVLMIVAPMNNTLRYPGTSGRNWDAQLLGGLIIRGAVRFTLGALIGGLTGAGLSSGYTKLFQQS